MPRLAKPTTNARRKISFGDFGVLTKKRPERRLTVKLNKHSGRDKTGRISVRHRGGGAKRLYRLVDFRLNDYQGKAEVKAIEYDPSRTAFIALVELLEAPKTKHYLIAPDGLGVGELISYNRRGDFSLGSRLPLRDIPLGTEIYNIELNPGRGASLVRSAGTWATLSAKEGKYAHLRLPSSEMRKVLLECRASIGRVSNPTNNRLRIAKAGRTRQMGIRPTVRGKAMYPEAHPHGGGEGVSPIGLKRPKTPWGKPALGAKTRRNKRSDKFIISRRKK